jgi:hypothetical protein
VRSRAGLERLLTPIVAQSDAQVEAVLASQQNLSASIDRLVSGAAPLRLYAPRHALPP